MKIKITLPKNVKKILNTLHNNGFSSWICGGAVRDSILSRPIKDWDICTSATPEQIMEVFKDEYIIPTGLQHGTVTIMLNGEGFEVTTFRQDGDYSDGRHPDSVKFTSSIYDDLARRDFTINAMAYNEQEGLIDPFGGLEDIHKRCIRCVGSPKERFDEDALRILRAIRFSCQLNFYIHPSIGWQIVHTDIKENLKNISMERINSELTKAIIHYGFADRLTWYYGLFTTFIPELEDTVGYVQNNPYHKYDVFHHTIETLRSTTSHDLIVKLALLFHDIGKPYCCQEDENGIRHFKGHGKVSAEMTDDIMRRLKFDNYTREKVVELVYYHDAFFEVGEKYVKRWLNKIGEEQFRRLLIIRKADIKGQGNYKRETRIEKVKLIETLLNKVIESKDCFSLKNLSINGNDVKQVMMLKEGKDIGLWLNKILDKVIDGELNNNREELIKWMEKNI